MFYSIQISYGLHSFKLFQTLSFSIRNYGDRGKYRFWIRKNGSLNSHFHFKCLRMWAAQKNKT